MQTRCSMLHDEHALISDVTLCSVAFTQIGSETLTIYNFALHGFAIGLSTTL